jgi:hypothetical protein
MSNPIVSRLETYYDLEKFKKASEDLAQANGLRGDDSFVRDSNDHPLGFGAASTNAIAHALTSAYLAHDHSAAEASILGWGREFNSYWFDKPRPPPAWDTFKDLYNNQVGRNIADYVRNNNLSRDQIQELVLDALSTGKLIVTQQDKRIDPSFNGDPRNFSLPVGDAAPWTAPSAGFSGFASSVTRIPVLPREGESNDLLSSTGQNSPSTSPVQGAPPPTPALQPDAVYSPAGDFFGNFPPTSDSNGSPPPADDQPIRRLGRTTYSQSQSSAFGTGAPDGIASRLGNASAPKAQPQNSEGPLSLMDAYLQYRKRLDANSSPVPAMSAGAPVAPPSDDSNFSGGLLGRLAALMGVDPQNPDQLAPPPDELRAFYRDNPAQPWTLQRWR